MIKMSDIKYIQNIARFLAGFYLLMAILILIGSLFFLNWGWHQFKRFSATQRYKTYESTGLADIRMKEISGKKMLAEADWSRKIQIADALAKAEAAKALAQVEIERAKGVAEANRIIGDSLKENEGYLRYLWIEKLHEGNQTIYIPTEAGLPILEAGRSVKK